MGQDGCFHKFGILFVGVLTVRPLFLGSMLRPLLVGNSKTKKECRRNKNDRYGRQFCSEIQSPTLTLRTGSWSSWRLTAGAPFSIREVAVSLGYQAIRLQSGTGSDTSATLNGS